MARVTMTIHADFGEAHATILIITKHGYFLVFTAVDPAGRETDAGSSTKALESLRFFGKPE